MKDKRHRAILDIIDEFDIETQEDLATELVHRGFKVTQATISRDIKELHLVKAQGQNGAYRYAINESGAMLNTEKLLRVFKETVLSVQSAGNLVVVGTLTGSANAAAEVVDTMGMEGIIGTIAGDNTIFIAVSDPETGETVAGRLKQLAK